MEYLGVFFSIAGSLGLFLYGMKVMSDGIQQAAGQRMQRVLSFMTGNRFTAVLTGCGVTALIQSSSATTVMVVSFVNAGLLTLKQAIGVIMGANIGTTVTAWIVSLVGFSLKIEALALPAVGIGFALSMIKWKHRDMGTAILGFGILFMGLDLLTKSMPEIRPETLEFINSFSGQGLGPVLLGTLIGMVITLIIHSSSASTAIVLTMAYQGFIGYEFSAAMILGANIGTTIDAALAAIGARPAAQQAALVHVLFNVIGTIWAVICMYPLLSLVDMVSPGMPAGPGITSHLAMFHTMFNMINTLVFFPFVNPLALLVSRLIKEKPGAPGEHYHLTYTSGTFRNTPELNIVRAEKEIRDMAGIVSSMYEQISGILNTLKEEPDKERTLQKLTEEFRTKEDYADQMREELTRFLMECTRQQLNPHSEQRISRLLRIIADLENMTDDCYGVSLLLERCIRKNQIFAGKSLKALAPYTALVGEFLNFVQARLGRSLSTEEAKQAALTEERINKTRNKLRKYGRKRIEAGENVKTELLFIDFVRRLEQLGDYCYSISASLAHLEG
ncbi:MAG: Na/Pi cotransporter family protein [Spirochaetaceae bacterium]|jgi:phosphate:Na+ symporter|nr:Na/Pi cotransporter family protein [Spirochaetaceae bacterium]